MNCPDCAVLLVSFMFSAELISNQYIFRHKSEPFDLIAVIHTIFNSNYVCYGRV